MAFPAQFLDELKTRVGLADVVSKRVKLVRKGREHHGLCPFHKEKTPSFTVNEDKGFYHCFGCGAHGSVFDFVMETQGLSFPEAVEQLARDAGMEVPRADPEERERAKRRKTLEEVNEAACGFFEQKLFLPEGREALDYLHRRGLTDDDIRRFRLGFAPDGRGVLRSALAREGVDDGLMVEAGLLIQPPDGGRDPYDRFRGRVIFPITDRRGRVVAFGGRILGDGEPKYLNSPETPIFHKGRTLYGLHQALKPARDAGRVIVCEGYMDVIALALAGFPEAVAPLGTALTEDHLRELWRVVPEPVLCFDGDAAGGRAAGRAAERALPLMKAGLGLRFAYLPEGLDPDDLIRSKGKPAMDTVLEAAMPLSEVAWRLESGGRAPQGPEDRAALQRKLDARVREVQDPTFRRHLSEYFRERLWPPRRNEPGRRGRWNDPRRDAGRRVDSRAETARAHEDPQAVAAEVLLATLINHPELFDAVEERLGTLAFQDAELDSLRQEVLRTLASASALDSSGLRDHLTEIGRGGPLHRLMASRVYAHAYFARPEADPAEARLGWDETYAQLRREDLAAEIRDAERAYAEDPTDENFARLREVRVAWNARQDALGAAE